MRSSIDDRLYQLFASGQTHHDAREFVEAANAWLQFWKLLKRHLKLRHKAVDPAQRFAPGQCDLEHWLGKFEQALHNGSLRDRSLIPVGREFLREWRTQFPEDDLNGLSTHNALVDFTMRDGDVAAARELMGEMLARWPNDPWTHIFLSDAHSHLFADPVHHLPFNRDLARQYLERALELATSASDREAVQQRLTDLHERQPRSETCQCCH